MIAKNPVSITRRGILAMPKGHNSLNGYGWRVWTPARRDIPRAVKDVQISCMNKLYTGIAFRNDSGGMEFYSNDYKSCLVSKITEDIHVFHEQLVLAESELAALVTDIDLLKEHIDEWRNTYRQQGVEYHHIQQQLDNLIRQATTNRESREGTSWTERFMLKKKLRQAENRKNKTKKLIDGYHECVSRKAFLEIFTGELREKICQKESDAVALGMLTVNQYGITSLPFYRGIKSKTCCVFADMLDYLAYIQLVNNKQKGLPMNCDSVVLNNPRNFLKLLLHCDTYDEIVCFFPDTVTGKTMEKTLLKRHESRARSMSSLYAGHVTLYGYSMSIDNHSPISLVL